jgi:hypothetical protein
MAIIKEESKSFPLYFQDGTKNANYASEYGRSLKNLPIGNQTNTYNQITGISSDTEKWWGGVLASNGYIYCAPINSSTILKINPNNNTVTEIGSFTNAAYKYMGGVLAPNGKIYFIPCSAASVLVLDPSNDTTYTFGIGQFTAGTFFWGGGALNKEGTKIYCSPSLSIEILVIDVTNDSCSTFGNVTDVSYKYTSACLAPNGFIYCFPSYGEKILKINTDLNTFTQVGTVVAGGSKYYSSVLSSDGFIYSLPNQNTTNIIKFNPITDTFVDIATTAAYINGACLGIDGRIYGAGNGAVYIFDPLTNIIISISNSTSDNTGMNLALNGKMYTMPRSATSIAVIGDEVQFNKNFALSRFNNKF